MKEYTFCYSLAAVIYFRVFRRQFSHLLPRRSLKDDSLTRDKSPRNVYMMALAKPVVQLKGQRLDAENVKNVEGSSVSLTSASSGGEQGPLKFEMIASGREKSVGSLDRKASFSCS